jgi:uncharacterized protein YgiM (DUF1202 family)
MAILIDNRSKIAFHPPANGKKIFELQLRNDPVQKVTALFDYVAQGKSNNKGELDMSFKKGDEMELVEERNNWWKCQNGEGKQGLVPSNYVAKIASSGEVKISVQEKPKKTKDKSKEKIDRKKHSLSSSSYQNLPLPPPTLLSSMSVMNLPPPPKEEELSYGELKVKYEEEKKHRIQLEADLAKANQEIKQLKEKLGK